MRADDFPFATKLANTMDWNMAMADFEFMSSLEPEGCFVAFQGSERLGIATSISFGNVGWFGNLIVKENARRQRCWQPSCTSMQSTICKAKASKPLGSTLIHIWLASTAT